MAPTMIGAQACNRSRGWPSFWGGRGRGAFCGQRSSTVRTGGARRSANAGTSSEKRVRNVFAVSLRFPGQRYSSQGQSGPKPRPKGVGDGQLVNIPTPPTTIQGSGGRGRIGLTGRWSSPTHPGRGSSMKVGGNPETDAKAPSADGANSKPPRKARTAGLGARTANRHR
jgi:hypothetical protein